MPCSWGLVVKAVWPGNLLLLSLGIYPVCEGIYTLLNQKGYVVLQEESAQLPHDSKDHPEDMELNVTVPART